VVGTVDSVTQPAEGKIPQGLVTLDIVSELKNKTLTVDSVKELLSLIIKPFNWIEALQYLRSLKLAIDLRFGILLEDVSHLNNRGVLFPLDAKADSVVNTHKFMQAVLLNKTFKSVETFAYPLKDGKELSSKSKNTYLRSCFRRYSASENNALVYIPGTVCYGSASGLDKNDTLKKATENFIAKYNSLTFDELNHYPTECPLCLKDHLIEKCPL